MLHGYYKKLQKIVIDSPMNSRYTDTLSCPRNWILSVQLGVNIIYYITQLTKINECRKTQFIYYTKKLEVLLVYADNLYLARGWDWIRMLSGLSSDTQPSCKEMLASCKYNWRLKGNIIHSGKQGKCYQENRSARLGVQRGKERYSRWWQSMEWNRGVQIKVKKCWWACWKVFYSRKVHFPVEKYWKGMVLSAEWNTGVLTPGEEQQWGLSSASCSEEVPILVEGFWTGVYGAPIEIGALPIQTKECRWGLWSIYPCVSVPKRGVWSSVQIVQLMRAVASTVQCIIGEV